MIKPYEVNMDTQATINFDLRIFKVVDGDDTELNIRNAWSDDDGDLIVEVQQVLATLEESSMIHYLRSNNIKTKKDLIDFLSTGSPF